MKNKVFKLFGRKVWETITYEDGEAPVKKVRKPQGEVLTYNREEYDKDQARTIENNGNHKED